MCSRTVALVSWLILLVPAGLCGGQADTATSAITGTVAYRLRIALPPDAVVNVRLEDVSLADAPAKLIAESTFATEGKQVPLPFALTYSPAQIVSSHRYGVRGTISSDGRMLFATTTANPVITQGAPTQLDLILDQVTPAAQTTAVPSSETDLEGTYWKLTFLGSTAVKPAGSSEAYLILHANDKSIAGSTGCNRLVGAYELKGNSLRFSPTATTMIACTSPLMKQEQKLIAALKSITAYRIADRRLELLNGDVVQARFQAKYLK